MYRRRQDESRPSFRTIDAFTEVWLDLISRPMRSTLTALGTGIGVGVLVCTVGLAQSANARITAHFDALAATEVSVVPAVSSDTDDRSSHQPVIPVNAPQRLAAINGVVSSATLTEIKSVSSVRGTPVVDPTAVTDRKIPVLSSSPDLPATVEATIQGRYHDRFHDDRSEAVAVIGAKAAALLAVASVERQPAIFIDDRPVVVIGILTSTGRRPELLDAVIVTDGFARSGLSHDSGPSQVLVRVHIGAADVVGRQVSAALRPDHPEWLNVAVPPTPTFTRDRVADDTQSLLLALSITSLVIGGVGIANVILVSVMERVGEIGLRRALGARRLHIVVQFLLEGTAIGFLGGIAGAAIGAVVTVVVSSVKDWPPVMDPLLPVTSSFIAGTVGLIASVYPAVRAGRVEPIAALRQAA